MIPHNVESDNPFITCKEMTQDIKLRNIQYKILQATFRPPTVWYQFAYAYEYASSNHGLHINPNTLL